jgi:hypothetical protein
MAIPEQKSVRRQVELTDAQIEAFVARLDKFLAGNLRKILDDLREGKTQRAIEAAKVLGSLRSSLDELGLQDQLRKIDKIYGTQLRSIDEYFSNITSSPHILSDADRTVAAQLIKFDASKVANKVYALTDDLSATIMRQVVTGQKPDVDSLVDDLGERTVAQITTELNTATSAFSRSVTQAKAKELGFDLFIYLGPDDSITRPFCRKRVNKIFTKAQIAGWDNETDLPADIYGGGYNCRHDIRPISEERAEELIKSGQAERG